MTLADEEITGRPLEGACPKLYYGPGIATPGNRKLLNVLASQDQVEGSLLASLEIVREAVFL